MSLTETPCIDKSRGMSKLDDDAMPRWVKVFGIVAILFVVAFIVLHAAGLAPHGH